MAMDTLNPPDKKLNPPDNVQQVKQLQIRGARVGSHR